MGLPNDIIDYFNTLPVVGVVGPQNPVLRSVQDFVTHSGADLLQSNRICSKLSELGFMMYMGSIGGNVVTGNRYYTLRRSTKYNRYGAYDNIYYGFNFIREKYTNSVLQVVVKKKNDDIDIGTSFIAKVADLTFLVTAKHCIENMNEIDIKINGSPVRPSEIIIPVNPNIDIAILYLPDAISEQIEQPFEFEKCEILDNILTIGYPSLPGFDSFSIAELSQINAIQKNSAGTVVAAQQSYLDYLDYLILNARVKSGNSGSPIINNLGFVSGILVNIPQNPEDQTKLDDLGYGLGLFHTEIEKLHNSRINNRNEEFANIPINESENGFRTN